MPETLAVHLSVDGGVVRIVLDRPPLNILTIDVMHQLAAALRDAAARPTTRVIVLAARGRAFSAGVDVGEHTADNVDRMLTAFHGLCRTLVATDVPLVVLVNHGSASSAEVFAGAIQDHGRGPIVGEQTFGTGTVLSSWELRDGSALLLGFAYWLTPNGRMIRDGGITPDVMVELPAGTPLLTPERTAGLSLEEVAAQDPQLGAAFALLPR